MSYTQEQIRANFFEASKRILPAVLSNTLANGHLVNARMLRDQIAPTPEGFVAAIKSLYRELDWVIKPARLIADQNNEKPAKFESPIAAERVFDQRKANIEARDKQLAENAKTEKLIEAAIAGYSPVHRTGRPFLSKKESEQARLRGYVKQQIARNADRKEILTIVNADLERLYSQEMTQNERL